MLIQIALEFSLEPIWQQVCIDSGYVFLQSGKYP